MYKQQFIHNFTYYRPPFSKDPDPESNRNSESEEQSMKPDPTLEIQSFFMNVTVLTGNLVRNV